MRGLRQRETPKEIEENASTSSVLGLRHKKNSKKSGQGLDNQGHGESSVETPGRGHPKEYTRPGGSGRGPEGRRRGPAYGGRMTGSERDIEKGTMKRNRYDRTPRNRRQPVKEEDQEDTMQL